MITSLHSPFNLKESYNNSIIEALKKNHGAYIDDSSFEKVIQYTTSVNRFTIDDEKHIVLVTIGERFCVRPFELGDDGATHLSIWKLVDIPKFCDSKDQWSSIELFNGKSLISEIDIGTITGKIVL